MLLKDGDDYVRGAAAKALGRQSNLSDEILNALVSLLKDEDGYVRGAAAYALSGHSNLSDKMLEAPGRLLGSENAAQTRGTYPINRMGLVKPARQPCKRQDRV